MISPEEIVSILLELGALELDSVDSNTGEIVYKVTEKLQDIFPEMYEEISEQVYRDAMNLWQKGLLKMDVTAVNPLVSPTEAALDRANWTDLSDGEYSTMNAVMRAFEGGIG